jgi:phosphoglycolate/pyridoxal phosphate phosphatase family enzyme
MSVDSLSHLNSFIFDLDGVIWKGRAPIEGAVESIQRLRDAGKRCFYCTNNSRRTPAEFAETLGSMGIECGEDEVMTSSAATALYLQSLFTGPFTTYIIGEEGLVQMIRRTGAIVMTSPILPQRSDLHENHGAVDCVIVGLDAGFTYHKLRLAQRLILGGARFIATNRDSTFPTPYGLVPGAGAIVAAIETATGTTPITLGKPQPLMAQLLMQKFGLAKEETAMVGDRLDTDIVSARRAGIGALFVATGVHNIELAERAKNLQKPDAIYTDLPSLCEAVLDGTSGATAEPDTEAAPGTDSAFGDEALTGAAIGTAGAAAAGATAIAAGSLHQEPAEALQTPFALESQEPQAPVASETLAETAQANELFAEAEAAQGDYQPDIDDSVNEAPVADSSADDDAVTADPGAGISDFSWDLETPATVAVEATDTEEATANVMQPATTAPASNAALFALEGDDTTSATVGTASTDETVSVLAEPADSPFAFTLEGADDAPVVETAAATTSGPGEPSASTGPQAQEEQPPEDQSQAEDDKWWESLDKA